MIYKTMVVFMWVGSTCILDLLLAIMCGIASYLFVLEIDEERVRKHDKRRK